MLFISQKEVTELFRPKVDRSPFNQVLNKFKLLPTWEKQKDFPLSRQRLRISSRLEQGRRGSRRIINPKRGNRGALNVEDAAARKWALSADPMIRKFKDRGHVAAYLTVEKHLVSLVTAGELVKTLSPSEPPFYCAPSGHCWSCVTSPIYYRNFLCASVHLFMRSCYVSV
ncbi:uncharacterized protein LOC110829914 isoform X2 [Zootermopsis nevadensis]|nr:uncharacterized protein LOC110829914 isoform X2 [Zootermopsis nevadensis]